MLAKAGRIRYAARQSRRRARSRKFLRVRRRHLRQPTSGQRSAIARGRLASRAAGAAVTLLATLLSCRCSTSDWVDADRDHRGPGRDLGDRTARRAALDRRAAPIARAVALTRSEDGRSGSTKRSRSRSSRVGVLIVRAPRPLQVSPEVRWSAALLLFLVATSAALTIMIVGAEHPDVGLVRLVGLVIVRDYLITMTPLAAALLSWKACSSCWWSATRAATSRGGRGGAHAGPRSTAAAALDLLRIVTAAFAQEHSWSAFLGDSRGFA